MDQRKQSRTRFRVLVLGKEGVGKSSLINHILQVQLVKVSEFTPGEADINRELFSIHNDSFILHDSKGYGVGEAESFRQLREFINHRIGHASMGDRLHAIWLCTATPFAGARLLEAGDEEIFRVVQGKVPIVVVFTRYDDLVRKKERQLHESSGLKTEAEIQSQAKSIAYQCFDKECLMPMKKVNSSIPCVCVSVKAQYEETLRNLVKTTLQHINSGEYR
jgi:predicted GTPase